MLIVKMTKYQPNLNEGIPASTEHECVREATAIHVSRENGHKKLQLGDAPGDIVEYTIGDSQDCSFTVAYVMNTEGKTIEIIR